jgi:hypothetical protein
MEIDENTSQEDLARYAYIVGDNEDGRLPLDQIEWTVESDFQLERFLEIMSFDEWKEWFDDELAMKEDQYGTDWEWRRLLEEDIEEAVVILDHEGLLIWDGWHRSAASVIKGKAPLVVLGRERTFDHVPKPSAPLPRP